MTDVASLAIIMLEHLLADLESDAMTCPNGSPNCVNIDGPVLDPTLTACGACEEAAREDEEGYCRECDELGELDGELCASCRAQEEER